ncbi:hypothetical protein [Amycolatopsis sp. cmx-4-68]|uniref:hypothetical protein n=1 Tax=Amycolatopsis sp. cmx-4-68 TaxID=2790938 RepID=UPI0039781466
MALAGRVSETALMVPEYAQSDEFRGARIHLCDLGGLEIRDCEVTGLKIVDCYGSDVYLGGYFERLVVNDVDVTTYVEAELDRRHPARALARNVASPGDYRAAWDAIGALWGATLNQARLLPTRGTCRCGCRQPGTSPRVQGRDRPLGTGASRRAG